MKRITFLISLFVASLLIFAILILYGQRDSRPTIICTSLDDSIRPRDYCLMNPFRDKQPEFLADKVFHELKNGNTKIILPYLENLNEEQKNHFLENETKYKIENWRIGNRKNAENKSEIMYWVSRRDYFDGHLENVWFSFEFENGEWKIKSWGAGY